MSDLTDDEMDAMSAGRFSANPAKVRDMISEIRRHRSTGLATEQQIRTVVRDSVIDAALDGAPRLNAVTLQAIAASVADRAAKRLAGFQILRPMSSASTSGPVVEILVATTDRAGCNGWLIAHHADGGGEEQPRFHGWFYWTGYDFRQLDSKTLLGWMPLPSPIMIKSTNKDEESDYEKRNRELHRLGRLAGKP